MLVAYIVFLMKNTICLTHNSRYYLCAVVSLNSHSSSQSHFGIRAKGNAIESTLEFHCVKDHLSIMSTKVKYFVPNYWNGVDEYKQHCPKPVVGYLSRAIRINLTHLTPSHISKDVVYEIECCWVEVDAPFDTGFSKLLGHHW